ncbi:metal ABC transporter ATP-binding protein [Fulvivirgaceae bacterium BMA12]|uniref:Metal ABC transporter ATP-binding protein n=1 Tax=Agaribacillus aureus TaxID=3051825 RepID=A0ABT8KYZ2_9BACT|nr:metal ABC transporter ATP-binding protein [Fulvivirgaceae bacterium BMA12]
MIQQVEDPAVEVHDLTVTYHKKPVLWDIDLTLPRGAIIGIIGPNGAGKSTLIKSMMNLIPHSSGYVRIFDSNIDEVRPQVSYVPQKESVDWDFPASVMDVVLMGRYARLGLFKRPRKADREVALDCLKKVGMEAYKSRQIAQLSGGQQQRVFLARALAQEAEIYFMDEPFAGVDAATEKAIIGLLREMSEKGKTVVVIHHDIQSALEYFNWIVLLNMRLVASGPTQETLIPSLLEETYGGKLTLLAEVGNLMHKKEFTGRDKR